jgi:hypothetical protein
MNCGITKRMVSSEILVLSFIRAFLNRYGILGVGAELVADPSPN